MDEWMLGLIIFIVGVFLLAIEIATPGQTFMAIPGTTAVILGLIAMALGPWLFSAVWYAPVIAVCTAIPVTALTVWLYKKVSRGHLPIPLMGDTLVGRQGVVSEKVVPDSNRGKVKIGSEMWSATASTEIPAGERVEVISSEGVHVIVERVDDIAKVERDNREAEDN